MNIVDKFYNKSQLTKLQFGETDKPFQFVDSDLFMPTPSNLYDEEKIENLEEYMQENGWDDSIPAIQASVYKIDQVDLDEQNEYEVSVFNRDLESYDIGREVPQIINGNHRAFAASNLNIPLKVVYKD